MSDQQCDIHDVTKAASDLVALGCTIGATSFYDSFTQLQFSSAVSNYVNEVIKDVSDGVISAWDGVQELTAEYAAFFYVQNGMVFFAGALQIKLGAAIAGGTAGWGIPIGSLFVAHGTNNMYEGGMNFFNGPDAPPAQGLTRKAYQVLLRDDDKGDMLYGMVDLGLSAGALMRPVRKAGSVQLFRRDSNNYEAAYKQTGKLLLFFEALVDAFTLNSIVLEESSKENGRN